MRIGGFASKERQDWSFIDGAFFGEITKVNGCAIGRCNELSSGRYSKIVIFVLFVKYIRSNISITL